MVGILDLQNMVDEWIKNFGGGYWKPLSMLAALMEEVGELSRILNSMEIGKSECNFESLLEEIGDVFFALICISNYYRINLEDALKYTLNKYTVRDFDRWIKK
ncbi:MAG: nucleotide pyrophosphohydrolase [Candidatus Methanomethylicia archaeon]